MGMVIVVKYSHSVTFIQNTRALRTMRVVCRKNGLHVREYIQP